MRVILFISAAAVNGRVSLAFLQELTPLRRIELIHRELDPVEQIARIVIGRTYPV